MSITRYHDTEACRLLNSRSETGKMCGENVWSYSEMFWLTGTTAPVRGDIEYYEKEIRPSGAVKRRLTYLQNVSHG